VKSDPAVEVVLDFLRVDGDRTFFVPEGGPALAALVEIALTRHAPERPLLDLLRLADVLEREAAAPAAADLIRSVIGADPGARKALSIEDGGDASVRERARAIGGEVAKARAPVLGASAPSGTIKASALRERARQSRAAIEPRLGRTS
jgi:hypothetical protein